MAVIVSTLMVFIASLVVAASHAAAFIAAPSLVLSWQCDRSL